MPTSSSATATIEREKDGRTVRREQNVQLAVNAARELFEETLRMPSIEDVAKKSGLSLRSMYRYFNDIQDVADAVVQAVQSDARVAGRLPDPAGISLADRIDAIARSRVALYQAVKGTYLANVARIIHTANPDRSGQAIRNEMLGQFEFQFAQELLRLTKAERQSAAECGHALCTLEFIDLLTRWRSMDTDEAVETIKYGLTKILNPQ